MNPSPFGRIVTAGQVEAAVLVILNQRLATYIAEVERQVGRTPSLPAPRSWRVWSEVESWPADQLPGIVVACPGTVDDAITRRPTGTDASWFVRVAAIVTASDQESTRRNAQIYAAAIRGCLSQSGGLDGRATATEWLGEETDIASESGRTWGLGLTAWEIDVPQVVQSALGPVTWPADPPDPAKPWPPWPPITDVQVDVRHQEDTP